MMRKMGRRTVLLMATTAVALVMASGVAVALAVQCDGAGDQDAKSKKCAGTNQGDNIKGNPYREVIQGLGGDDFVFGGDGKDKLYGEAGADTLEGENGNDTSFGGDGDDTLAEFSSETGNDKMNGESGHDFLQGGLGNDVLRGGDDDEISVLPCVIPKDVCESMFGNQGNDKLYGGPGNDGMEGNEGNDKLFGEEGDDFIDAANDETSGSVDTVDCGSGIGDSAIVNQNDKVKNCENIAAVPNP
jgi:Ca2+-binding RTX toxin-like protein